MFWQSVLHGLGVLLHWQTYVVALIYIIINSLPFVAIMFCDDKSDGLLGKGDYLMVLIRLIFQAFAVFVAVCTLFPIMLGADGAAWSLPWKTVGTAPVRTLIMLVIMLVLSTAGAFLPILGRANSFTMLIMGGVVLVSLTLAIYKNHPEIGIQNIELIPGWLTISGIVFISGVTSWLGILVAAAIVTFLFKDNDDVGQMITMPLGSVFGFIPIAIYAAWIGLQIQGL